MRVRRLPVSDAKIDSPTGGSREPLARHAYGPGGLEDVLRFVRRTRDELRELRMVRVWANRCALLDVNHDSFVIEGLGYDDDDLPAVLDAVNAAYKRANLPEPPAAGYKEFKTGRRYPWARDRVM